MSHDPTLPESIVGDLLVEYYECAVGVILEYDDWDHWFYATN
jgi:hypothetical protein